MPDVVEIFFSYAHADEALMNDVRRQLIVYERNGRILKWHDRQIPAGSEWRAEIDWRLHHARVVLLFVSPHFIESRYCYEVEGAAALRRHETGEARVIPVILRPCSWQEAPFGKLQALPRDGKPVSQWADRDEASLEVARGVMAAVDALAGETNELTAPSVPHDSGSIITLRDPPTVRVTRTDREIIPVNIVLSSGVRISAEVPVDVLVSQLLPILVEKLSLPATASDGRPLSFRLSSRSRGTALATDLTLRQNGVQPGETLSIHGEFTAG
jgi:hypothetical protein